MRSFVKNRLAEVREHLGPALSDLGLSISVENSLYDTSIRFVRDRPFAYSPVSIRFGWNPEYDDTGHDAQWSEAYLSIDDMRAKPLGSTGWSHRRWWGSKEIAFEKTGEAMFSWISSSVRRRKLIAPSEEPQTARSEEMADAYWEIGRKIKDLAVVRIDMEGDTEREALTFQDHLGRRVHMAFGGTGYLLIDGEVVGHFPHHRTETCALIAEQLKTGYSPVTSLLYSPGP